MKKTWLISILVAGLAALVFGLHTAAQANKTRALEDRLLALELKQLGQKGFVDLNTPDFQRVENTNLLSFAVSSITNEKDGINIKGRILNVSSVSLLDAQLSIEAGDGEEKFTVKSIPAGSSRNFSVLIKNAGFNTALFGKITYVSALIISK